MKPDKIILIRHGQSQGNVDKMIYATRPDYALELSTKGCEQAHSAGEQLKSVLAPGDIQFYVSPYWRTRMTQEILATRMGHAGSGRSYSVYEDPRLREQEWSGDFRKLKSIEEYQEVEERRDSYGHFYFRLEGGESCADVFDRMSDFMNTLHRDFEKRNFPRNAVIVSHGMTMRLFLMRWFHMTVEAFEALANPFNCEFWVMERNLVNDKFTLVTELRRHKLKHSYQYVPLNLRRAAAAPMPSFQEAVGEIGKTITHAFKV